MGSKKQNPLNPIFIYCMIATAFIFIFPMYYDWGIRIYVKDEYVPVYMSIGLLWAMTIFWDYIYTGLTDRVIIGSCLVSIGTVPFDNGHFFINMVTRAVMFLILTISLKVYERYTSLPPEG
jgi:hypothetical protein